MQIDDWTPVATSLPDDDTLVLLAFGNGEVWPGVLDSGTWRDTSALPLASDQVTHWMHFPPAPAVPGATA